MGCRFTIYPVFCIILQLEWISQSESSITSEYKSVFHTKDVCIQYLESVMQ